MTKFPLLCPKPFLNHLLLHEEPKLRKSIIGCEDVVLEVIPMAQTLDSKFLTMDKIVPFHNLFFLA
jgi:hypothetical protein